MDVVALKQQALEAIDAHQDALWAIVSSLYHNPEIAFEEVQSSATLCDFLSEMGFEVEQGVGGLPTAFNAVKTGQPEGPTVAFLAEYDALPGLGHACGHNLIAAAALGAGVGLSAVLGSLSGTLRVIGTPAEEGGGGKRIMADAGVFEGVDAAMMVHPAAQNLIRRGSLASMRLVVEYFGKPSHAAAFPQKGVNALDAMLLLFNGINALRQKFEPKDRVAGIILHGGDAANVIPAYSAAEFSVRGETTKRRKEVLEMVLACAHGAAKAVGCEIKVEERPGYDEMVPNKIVADLFSKNMKIVGRETVLPIPNQPMGSTDMGNVSSIVPAIHPYMATVPMDVGGHTVEFREICFSEKGRQSMLDGAKSMALTAIDLLSDPALVESAQQELQAYWQEKE